MKSSSVHLLMLNNDAKAALWIAFKVDYTFQGGNGKHFPLYKPSLPNNANNT